MGLMFIFNRETGEPVFGMEERAVLRERQGEEAGVDEAQLRPRDAPDGGRAAVAAAWRWRRWRTCRWSGSGRAGGAARGRATVEVADAALPDQTGAPRAVHPDTWDRAAELAGGDG